jgi:hypothetical protein
VRRWSLLLVLAACAPAPDAEVRPLPAPDPAPWTLPDRRPALDGAFFDAHPALRDLSWFADAVEGPLAGRPDPQRRGAFGVGNGLAFALLGMTDPLNALHGLVGPTYDNGGRFFGDVGVVPVVDGLREDFRREAVARPRGTALAVTRGEVDDVVVSTVDFAPRPAGVGALDVPPAIVRLVVVRAGSAHDLALDLVTAQAWEEEPDGALQAEHPDGRVLRVASTTSLGGLRLDLGEVAAGEEIVVPIVLGFGRDAEAARAITDAALAADLDAWLDDTVDAWRAESARGVQLDVGDPVLLDLLDALRVTVRVQQSAAGGVVPASRYTSTWLRDTLGPVRFWTRLGLFDEARAAVDYLELCHRRRGDYGNACDSGLVPSDVVGDPPWDELPPFSGRTAAEGPSHVPLAWAELDRWTGDRSRLAASWPNLRRGVLAQTLTPEGLQPWSGDETFRLAMEVAWGWPLNSAWEDIAWSSNSSLVLLPAARWLADAAADVAPEDAALFEEIARRGRDGLAQFVRPDGHLAAVILRDDVVAARPDLAALAPEDRPFEDAALAAIWTGALAPDDPVAVAALTALDAVAGHDDGTFLTPPALDLGGDLASGVATGMLPGYGLWNLVATGHPKHPAAFDAVLAYATSSGELAEAHRYGDRAPLMPIYDAAGAIGDVSARYRPWEGGIVGDALLFAILGAEPVDGGLRLVPRVPNGLDHLHAGPIVAPGVRAEVDLAWDGDGWVAEVTNGGDDAFTLDLRLPLGAWDDVDVEAEGGALDTLPLGERIVRFAPVVVEPGATVSRTVRGAR